MAMSRKIGRWERRASPGRTPLAGIGTWVKELDDLILMALITEHGVQERKS
eukprot:CAMPEP_0181341432 /NCGR_PEP_ID=MMETSP1101-20121128/30409_1 /TAXON_ID=46948 /ORGANISM="Rhodomonas abbreviata, Strain Caron Lab Isolate" /LENGTH=50 /DNA_ID=CAMNT_0023452713 /DNA_START=1494 /DNA_END=1646 /DNA_ORIENTATION=+